MVICKEKEEEGMWRTKEKKGRRKKRGSNKKREKNTSLLQFL